MTKILVFVPKLNHGTGRSENNHTNLRRQNNSKSDLNILMKDRELSSLGVFPTRIVNKAMCKQSLPDNPQCTHEIGHV